MKGLSGLCVPVIQLHSETYSMRNKHLVDTKAKLQLKNLP